MNEEIKIELFFTIFDRIKDLIYGGRYARKMKTVLDPSNIVKNDSMYVIIANYQ